MLSNIAERLADMHDAGYVHRDIKPANVVWLPRQNRWTVIDFGCAARIGQDAPLSFTLAYAAPEVVRVVYIRQHCVESTPALDAWSLGVMAFELLTGASAFDFISDGRARVRSFRIQIPSKRSGHLQTPGVQPQSNEMRTHEHVARPGAFYSFWFIAVATSRKAQYDLESHNLSPKIKCGPQCDHAGRLPSPTKL